MQGSPQKEKKDPAIILFSVSYHDKITMSISDSDNLFNN